MAKDGTDVMETGDGIARRGFGTNTRLETRRSPVSAVDSTSQTRC
jgi:hypothetical protein